MHLISVVEQKISHLYNVPRLKDEWYERNFCFKGIDLFQFTSDSLAPSCFSGLYFFNGEQKRNDNGNEGRSNLETPGGMNFNRRKWTNILLAINVL